MQSPGFSKFRGLMDTWDQYVLEEEAENNLRHFLDMHGLILFFKKDGDYFAAGEDSRVVFARLKNPDKDSAKGWEDEASFSATNLSKMVRGEPSTNVFDKDDIKKIKIVDKEKVLEDLKSNAAEKGSNLKAIRFIKLSIPTGGQDRDDAQNFLRTDEE